MSDRYFAVLRTTNLMGKPVLYFAVTLAIAAGALTPITAQAQSGSDVYKRMSDAYAYAKSYQGTILRVEKGKTPEGISAGQTVTVQIRFKAPNKYVVNSQSSANVGEKVQNSVDCIVTDGKTSFTFYPDKKLYQRGQIQNQNLLSQFFAQVNPANGFSMLPESTVNGRAAFVIKPNLPRKTTPTKLANDKKLNITLMIDKQNYQLLKMTIETPNGNLVETVSGQAMNGPVPDTIFVWTPSASYKEIKPKATSAGVSPSPGKHTGPIEPRPAISP